MTPNRPYHGVSWHKSTGKWMAHVKYRNITCAIGFFDTALEAARQYDKVILRSCLTDNEPNDYLSNPYFWDEILAGVTPDSLVS